MPIKAALNDLCEGVTTSLHSFWQIRAANAAMVIFSENALWTSLLVEFNNLPASVEVPPPSAASFSTLRSSIQSYISGGRASTDFFLAIISQFESFLSTALTLKGASPSGTLGNLTQRVESLYGIASSGREAQVVAEIRERRNAIIHSHGLAGQRYLDVAIKPFVAHEFGSVMIGQKLEINDAYLARAADGLIAYARCC